MARKKGKANQNKLLKKFSKGGFSGKEKKTLRKKLGLNRKSVSQLTKAYSKQLKIGGSSNKSKVKRNKWGTPKATAPKMLTKKGQKAWKKSKGKKGAFDKYMKTPRPGMGVLAKNKNKKKSLKIKQPPNINLKGALKDILDREAPEKKAFKIDPKLQGLLDEQKAQNLRLEESLEGFKTDNEAYRGQIDALTTRIGGYEDDIRGYQGDLESKITDLKNTARDANQFKLTSTEYLNNQSAGGIRLKRSKRFRTGDFALGTGRLNRDNRKLKVGNVNL